jgi:hypothetical protein
MNTYHDFISENVIIVVIAIICIVMYSAYIDANTVTTAIGNVEWDDV